MNRQIKFRGKPEDKLSFGDWVYGSLIDTRPINGETSYVYIYTEQGKIKIIPETLGEFCGTYDTLQNEVYENDIIQNCDNELFQIVYWNIEECAWYCKYAAYDNRRIVSLADSLGNLNVVIGDIFDNPEHIDTVS